MPYLRKKGKYFLLVEGVRDPESKKVKQKVLKYYGLGKPDQPTIDLDIILHGPDNKDKDEYIKWPKDKMKAYADMYSGYELKDGQAKAIVMVQDKYYVVTGVETGPLHITTVRMVEVVPSNQYNGKTLEYFMLNHKGPNFYWGLKFMVDHPEGFKCFVIIPGGKSLVLVNETIYEKYMQRIGKIAKEYNTETPLPNIEKVVSDGNTGVLRQVQEESGHNGRQGNDQQDQEGRQKDIQGPMPRLCRDGLQDNGESVAPTTERGDGDAK